MENTVKNMKVVVTKIKQELNQGRIKEVKTLVDSYSNLLSILMNRRDIDVNFIESLENQNADLLNIKNKIDSELITQTLLNGEYKESHSLTLTSGRLHSIIDDLTSVLVRNLYPKIQEKITYVVSNKDNLFKLYDKLNNEIDSIYTSSKSNDQFLIKSKNKAVQALVHVGSNYSLTNQTVYVDIKLKGLDIKIENKEINWIEFY